MLFLERAVALDAVPQALFLLGSCFYEMGKLAPAVKHLQEAVRLDPAFEEAYHLLGLAYLDRHWNRKALEAFRQAQRLNPKKLQYQDLVRYLSGRSGSPLPGVDGEAGQWFGKAEEALAGDNLKQALSLYRRALAHRAREPDRADVLRHALPAPQPQPGDRGGDPQGAGPQPRRDAQGDRLRRAHRGAAQPGQVPRGQPRRRAAASTRASSNFAKTIAYYEMAYNLAEMEEDLDAALDYAKRSVELSPDELKQFPLAALGWVHYKRKEFEQGGRLPVEVERAGPVVDHPHPPRHGAPRLGRGGPGAQRPRPRARAWASAARRWKRR